MPRRRNSPNFEETLRELESLVEQMEQGELSLEESVKAFERGIELTRACQKALDDAEQKVEILTRKGDVVETESLQNDDEQ